MKQTPLIIIGLLVVCVLVFGGYKIYDLDQDYEKVQSEFASSTAYFENKVRVLENDLYISQTERSKLEVALGEENRRTQDLESEREENEETIDTLEKLTTIDPQLLQKYSKIFFLNENYEPAKLADVPEEFLYDENKPQEIHKQVLPFLDDLIDDAAGDDIELNIVSAYRSFGTQESLKAGYKVTYGAGTANQFSADQGYSEHQLGTTVDLTTPALGANFESIDSTAAFAWLQKNAYKHGFILSYPKGNAYYVYEPWHWRFVGQSLARYLYKNKKNFYDMDQRTIDEYRVKLFD